MSFSKLQFNPRGACGSSISNFSSFKQPSLSYRSFLNLGSDHTFKSHFPRNFFSGFKISEVGKRTFSVFCKFLNERDHQGNTPLHLGVKINPIESRYDFCKKLLGAGANPNTPDYVGRTPLAAANSNMAKDNKFEDMVKLHEQYHVSLSQW